MGLLKTIAIIVLVYYGIKFIGRLFAPFLLKKMANKMNNQFQQGTRQNQQQEQAKKEEGEVTVEGQQHKTKFSKKDGEYVDFEEVKDSEK